MGYSALYRRLRPKKFKDIVGQEHIVKTLKNQIAAGRVSHAYLFCGTRGTGKTTSSLVFARAVNCTEPRDGEPCGICRACEAIETGRSFNIIEIDAASNNGVENIRDIKEEVKYPPAEGRYKVYIIDEAHMLSVNAFNALLKTLEEPPPGVIFILATTDPQKVPPTVHSRCQRFDFKRIVPGTMADALEGYLEDEGISFDREAVNYAARIADGSMRDALSLLDQCSAFYMGEKITLERLMDITGSVSTEVFFALLDDLSSGDVSGCIDIIDGIIQNGKDIHQVASDFLTHLRNVLIVLTVKGETKTLLDFSAERVNALRERGSGLSVPLLMRYITAFSELTGKLRQTGNPRLLLEVACISLAGRAARMFEEAEPAPTRAKPTQKVTEPVDPKRVNDSGFTAIVTGWGAFAAGFDAAERSWLAGTRAEHTGGNVIAVVCENEAIQNLLKTKKEKLCAKIREKFGLDAHVEITVAKPEYNRGDMDKISDMINMDINVV